MAHIMNVDDVLAELEALADSETLDGMSRYGIPNDNALGVPMRAMKGLGKEIGKDHDLALDLWQTGVYEARTVAVFVEDPAAVTRSQMNRWARDFDSWAICDTACFHLFDRTSFAWRKTQQWAPSKHEFVRRGAFALLWALALHDKKAADQDFVEALTLIKTHADDERPLVRKGIDMALRAVGQRNLALHAAALEVADRLAESPGSSAAWIGRHSAGKLRNEKLVAKLRTKD